MRRPLAKSLAAVLCLGTLAAAGTAEYSFSPAGNFPGALITYPLADNLTEIVGYYLTDAGEGAYRQTSGVQAAAAFLTINPPGSIGGGCTFASGINKQGVLVGGYCVPPQGGSYPQAQHGYTWDHGIYTTIDYPEANTTAAYGINDLGQVVGGYCNPKAPVCPDGSGLLATDHGFLDTQGTFTTLDYPGAQGTQPNAINDAGVAVGIYSINNTEGHGFEYQNGVFSGLSVPGSTFTYPAAINNQGVVAGYYQTPDAKIHGFIYQNGKFQTVDYPGTTVTGLNGINDAGMIVGNWGGAMGKTYTFKGIPAGSATRR